MTAVCDEHFQSLHLNGKSSPTESNRQDRTQNGHLSPTHSAHGCLMRTSLQKLSLEKKAKKVRFYRNGDRFFKGLTYALSLERIRTFDSLLEDLTRILVDQVNLPKGVRHIFHIQGKEKITTLDQLEEGQSYVCSSIDSFVKLEYTQIESPQWSLPCKNVELTNGTLNKAEIGSMTPTTSMMTVTEGKQPQNYIRPKLITVIRNGIKPRKAIRILLNKKTARSFDQVLNDITSSIKLDTGAVRKVFTLSGKQVSSLADFFGEEEIFIAYGPERYSHDDFDLDSEECKLLGANRVGSVVKNFRRSRLVSPSLQRQGFLQGHQSGETSANISPNSGSPKSQRKAHYKYPQCQCNKVYQQNGQSPVVVPIFPNEITERYLVGKLIGDGNFATVYACKHRITLKEYALKVIDKTKCKGKEHMIASEVAILRKVAHPNIVQLLEEFDALTEQYMVMELVKGGDLFDAIQSSTKYTERDASSMIFNLASALNYLHSMNIVHRDIKPENLLVVEHEDGSKSLKLGDFGLAIEVTETLYTICGTPTYVAPEILSESGYGLKVDIWAAGVIMYILLCGFPPFVSHSNDQEELFDQILSGKYEFTSPYWDDVSQSAKELISCMLQVEPSARLTSAQVLADPWVAGEIPLENDMQMSVSRKLSMHFDHKPRSSSLNSAGIALIAQWYLNEDL